MYMCEEEEKEKEKKKGGGYSQRECGCDARHVATYICMGGEVGGCDAGKHSMAITVTDVKLTYFKLILPFFRRWTGARLWVAVTSHSDKLTNTHGVP